MSDYLLFNKENLDPLDKVKINNLIDSTTSPLFIHPPHVILIQNFEPLRLAKKKHYQPIQSALKIQKRTGANKPQGRPFNSNLNARFLLFNNFNDLILNLLNIKEIKLGYLQELTETSPLNISKKLIVDKISISNNHFQLKSICFEKFNSDNNSKFDIYNELCTIFNTKELSFIKTIRNNKGKLIKFEIMSSLNSMDLNIDFIKKFITYPRYKSKMKIFLINKKFNENIWFYNDLRMLIWDLNNLKIENTKIMLNNDILV